MKPHRFFWEFDENAHTLSVTDKNILNQWEHVLRFKRGADLILVHNGLEAKCKILELSQKEATLEVQHVTKNNREPFVHGVLYCSVLKGEHFELVCQKATETGIAEIIPLQCERTIKSNIKQERLERIIKEAAEQSGRGVIPKLHSPLPFLEAIVDTKQYNATLFFDQEGERFEPHEYSLPASPRIALFIGPEGGWSEEEKQKAHELHYSVLQIGPRVLRAETAAIIASFLVSSIQP